MIRKIAFEKDSLDIRMEKFLENLLRDGLFRQLRKNEPTTKG